MWFGQVFVAYQRLFYVTLDKDGQPLSFDRAAAGIGVGGGVDYFPTWLSRSASPWRFADDGRMRLRGVFDLSNSLLSFGFYPTTLQSLSFKILLVKPL
jgi:hypothetical protein